MVVFVTVLTESEPARTLEIVHAVTNLHCWPVYYIFQLHVEVLVYCRKYIGNGIPGLGVGPERSIEITLHSREEYEDWLLYR